MAEEEKKDKEEEQTDEGSSEDPGAGLDDADILRESADSEEEAGGEEEDGNFEVLVEDAGACEKTVTVEVPAETVSEEIEKNLDSLKTTMPMRGFRKGRIPKNLLVRRHGKRVREEVRSSLVSRGIVRALKAEKLEPIAYPEVDEEALAIEEGEAFKFTFTVDVKPAVDITDYVGIAVGQPPADVADEDVEREIEGLRKRFGTLEPVEDGAAQAGDHLVATLVYAYEGASVHTQENVSFPLPEDEASELYKAVPWVEEVLGKKGGDTVETDTTFPDDFPVKKVRGKKGRLTVTLEEVKRLRVPEMGEELFTATQVENEEELREKVKTQIGQMKESSAQAVVEKRILDKLLETVPIDLPERVIERSLASQRGKAELKLRDAKVPEDEIPEKLEAMVEERRDEMAKEFKAFFIVEEIAKREKIYVTEDDVQERIQMLAYNYQKWPQQVEQELEEKGLMEELRGNLKQEKVLAFLREKAEITIEEPGEEKDGEDS